MSKTMNCCGCAPLAVATIYSIMEKLEREGRICPCACATAKSRLIRLDQRRAQRKIARTFVLDAAE